jgi:hypothetical protein
VIQSKFVSTIALGCLIAGSSFAQNVISAKSGLINWTEGQVFLGDSAVKQKFGEYADMKKGQHLRTEEGRAEILLTPGVFLRVAENSEIAMISNALSDTRIEVARGSVVVEASEISKENSVEFLVSGSRLDLRKTGVFRIDATDAPRIRAYDGEIALVQNGQQTVIKEGRQVLLTSVPVTEKFSKDDTDPFFRWAARRSGYVAAANLSAARYLHENNYSSLGVGGWFYSPFIGMFTYIPGHGYYRNMWNYAYYSPSRVYEPAASWNPGPRSDGFSQMGGSRGMADMGGRSYGGMNGGGGYQAPATSAPAPSAPAAARGGDSGASRGGGSGHR